MFLTMKEPDWLNVVRRQLVGRISNTHVNSRPSVFCFSSPRSGSTMMMEYFNRDAKMKVIDEPLSVNSSTFRVFAGLSSWEEACRLRDRRQVYGRYFSEIISNQI